MKRVILVLVMLLIPSLVLANKVNVNVPPTRMGTFYNADTGKLSVGALWELLSYQDRTSLETGIVDTAFSAGINYNILRLEDFGVEVKGWARAIKPAIGIWIGYDAEKGKVKGGTYISIVQLKW